MGERGARREEGGGYQMAIRCAEITGLALRVCSRGLALFHCGFLPRKLTEHYCEAREETCKRAEQEGEEKNPPSTGHCQAHSLPAPDVTVQSCKTG